MKKFRVIWDEKAIAELKSIYDFIAKDSLSAAGKVKDELLRTAKDLITLPKKILVYQFADQVSGEYRFVVRWSYRIIYEVMKDDIHVVRIIHTNKYPLKIIL